MKKVFVVLPIFLLALSANLSFPVSVSAVTCGTGSNVTFNDIGGGQCQAVITTTGAGTFTVPSDWNNSNNSIAVWGGGGGGSANNFNSDRSAGGGGAYSAATNESLTPLAVVNTYIGTGGSGQTAGAAATAGKDTYFNRGVSATTTCSTQEPQSACAKGGGKSVAAAVGAGGAAASGLGDTRNSGGALTFTRTGGNQAVGRIVSYSGGQSTPLDTGTSNTLIVASATATTSSITTAEAGELIVTCLSPGDTYNASAFDAATDPTTASGATDTTTAPTNGTWLERTDVSYGGGADGGMALADAIRETAGATGIIQGTSGGSARHVMMAGAFKVSNVIAPTVTTNFAVPGATTATLSGTKTGGDATVNYGFAYSTNATLSSGVATSALGVLSFDSTFTDYISGLTENQTYYFRAYATNTAGSAYGVIKSFLTGNSTPRRTMRLFQGAKIKLVSGRMILRQAVVATAPPAECGTGSNITFTDIGGGQCRGYITSGTTFTVPSNWTTTNTIEAIGAGGRGTSSTGQGAGGGGAYAAITGWSGSGSISVQIGTGNGTTGSGTSPTANTWFEGGSTLVAAGGASTGSGTGGAGGSEANSFGTTLSAGGKGGNDVGGNEGGGGGGAAGPNGDGVVGFNATAGNGGAGGAGDAGFGGAGGTAGAGNGGVGGNGTEWDATHGSGGGGGGGALSGSSGANGGSYGGGGGTGNSAQGNGQPGIIVITYTPA